MTTVELSYEKEGDKRKRRTSEKGIQKEGPGTAWSPQREKLRDTIQRRYSTATLKMSRDCKQH